MKGGLSCKFFCIHNMKAVQCRLGESLLEYKISLERELKENKILVRKIRLYLNSTTFYQ